MLNGQEVALPVNESDSLATKIEMLRMFLEQQLDTMPFLRWVAPWQCLDRLEYLR
jgi:hypothetical protein